MKCFASIRSQLTATQLAYQIFLLGSETQISQKQYNVNKKELFQICDVLDLRIFEDTKKWLNKMRMVGIFE